MSCVVVQKYFLVITTTNEKVLMDQVDESAKHDVGVYKSMIDEPIETDKTIIDTDSLWCCAACSVLNTDQILALTTKYIELRKNKQKVLEMIRSSAINPP